MPNEAELRKVAREVLRAGKLPRQEPDRTWGGPGVGALCAVCEKPVTRDEMEYEVQFAPLAVHLEKDPVVAVEALARVCVGRSRSAPLLHRQAR